MKNKLERIRVIDEAELSGSDYLSSLIKAAGDKGLLGDDDIRRIQFGCVDLLEELTLRLNRLPDESNELLFRGTSSSVKAEIAHELLASVFFTVGLHLKTCDHPDDAVDLLKREPIAGLYRLGRSEINGVLGDLKKRYVALVRHSLVTQSKLYNETLTAELPRFFKNYKPDFAAHETHHIDWGYPLFVPLPELRGVEYISAYIDALRCENELCRGFDTDSVHRLLRCSNPGYAECSINVYGHVLTAALGCVLTGSDVLGLDIGETGEAELTGMLRGKDALQIANLLSEPAKLLCDKLGITGEAVLYIKRSLPVTAAEIELALRLSVPHRVFYRPE